MRSRSSIASSLSASCLILFATVPICFAQEDTAPKLDNYGDPLPPGAVLRLGTTRLMNSGGFTWLPDGKTLVTARHGKLLFWDATTGKRMRELTTPIHESRAMVFRCDLACSADGKRLVCAGRSGHFCACNLETGEFISSTVPKEVSAARIESIAIDPRGTKIAAVNTSSRKVRFWDAQTCELSAAVELPRQANSSVAPAFSPDGKTLAVAAGRRVVLVSVDGSRPLAEIADVHGERVQSVVFTNDGARLITGGVGAGPSGGEQAQIRLWNAATLKLIQELKVPADVTTGSVLSLAANDKTLVSAHQDRILVWDLSGDLAARPLEQSRVSSQFGGELQVAPNGKLVAAASFADSFVRIWDVKTGKPLLQPGRRHSRHITAVAFSSDGRSIATGGADNEIRVWNAQTGAPLRTISQNGWIYGLAFRDTDRQLLVSAEARHPATGEYTGVFQAFDVATGNRLYSTDLPERGAGLSLSPTAKLVAITSRTLDDGPVRAKLRLFEAASGRKVTEVPKINDSGFENSIPAFHWSKDGKSLLAACEDNTVRQIELESGKVLKEFAVPHLTISPASGEPLEASVQSAAFLGPDRLVTGSMLSGELIGWNLPTGDKLWTIQPPQTSVRRLAISPDRKLLACTSSIGRYPYWTHLSLWDAATQRQLADVELGQEDATAMAFSPSGQRLLVGFTDGNAVVYDVEALGKAE